METYRETADKHLAGILPTPIFTVLTAEPQRNSQVLAADRTHKPWLQLSSSTQKSNNLLDSGHPLVQECCQPQPLQHTAEGSSGAGQQLVSIFPTRQDFISHRVAIKRVSTHSVIRTPSHCSICILVIFCWPIVCHALFSPPDALKGLFCGRILH